MRSKKMRSNKAGSEQIQRNGKRNGKNRVLTVLLSAAALSAFMAGSAFASGWTQENGTWYYLDSSDTAVTNEWREQGAHSFYLGSDGAMLTDQLIEDDNGYYYYVNADGAMVTNEWRLITSETDGGNSDADGYYYYFGSNGRAYARSSSSTSAYKREINGNYYIFDENGHMLTGWVDEDGNMIDADQTDAFTDGYYYCGEANDGRMRRAEWLEYTESTDASSNISGVDYEDYDSLWFYFDSNGKKYSASDSSDTTEKTINGYKYSFDQNGVMLSSFVSASSSTATDSKYFSTDSTGQLKKNEWIYAIPTEDMDPEDYEDEQYRWFYAGSSGKLYTDSIKKINGKKYLFDEIGRMQIGLVVMNADGSIAASYDSEDDELVREDFTSEDGVIASALSGGGSLYYFGTDEETDGAMKTGKSVKITLSDDSYTFGFDSNGKAYGTDGVELVSNKYYLNGLLLAADSDNRYGLVDTGSGLKVVGTNGTAITGSHRTVKDGNDGYLVIVDNVYYGYAEDDHAPVYYEGQYYHYDSDETGNRGALVEQDTDGSAVPSEMQLNF